MIAVAVTAAPAQAAPPGCQKSYTRADFHQTIRKAHRDTVRTRHEVRTLRRVFRCQARPRVSRPILRRHAHRYLRAWNRRRIAALDPRAYARYLLARRGWSSQWGCLNSLINKESGWNPKADNPHSDAYGIPQALPGSKMASHGADWATNPRTQLRWMMDYIAGRHRDPCGAWAHSQRVGWY